MINPAFALARTLPATMQFRRRFTLAARQLSRVVVQPSSKSSWKLEKGEKSIYLRFDTPEHTRERKFHRSGLSDRRKTGFFLLEELAPWKTWSWKTVASAMLCNASSRARSLSLFLSIQTSALIRARYRATLGCILSLLLHVNHGFILDLSPR